MLFGLDCNITGAQKPNKQKRMPLNSLELVSTCLISTQQELETALKDP